MSSIKKFRESLGLTQEYLAGIIETSKVNYGKKENGTVKFSLDEANAISQYFNRPIEEIFFEHEISKKETEHASNSNTKAFL